MHITDKDAGQISPPRPHPPLRHPAQRSDEAQYETFRLLVWEFDNWLTAHEKEESHRIEFEFRLSTMKSLYAPYFKLLMNQADLRYFDLKKEFRDRYYEVIARAEIVLRSEPQNA